MPTQPKEKGNRHIAENPVIADCFHTDSPPYHIKSIKQRIRKRVRKP